jgi:hypothetical protein
VEAVERYIVSWSFGFMYVSRSRIDAHNGVWLPFGYYLECDANLLLVRRPDGSFVAAFNAVGADLFEVELAVWEDAD